MTAQQDMKWQDFAVCNGIENQNLFFDDYESDVVVAMNTDKMCTHCPVAIQCLEDGESGNEWGVWGGVWLSGGKIDQAKNSHKNTDDWKVLEKLHGRDFSKFYKV